MTTLMIVGTIMIAVLMIAVAKAMVSV